MNKKIALITGANKGIGFETARQLAQKQITVLLGSRDKAKGESVAAKLKAEGLDVRPIEIDVTNAQSIRKAAERVEKEFGHLDILINNAGTMLDERQKESKRAIARDLAPHVRHEPVRPHRDDSSVPSSSPEERGRSHREPLKHSWINHLSRDAWIAGL